MQSSNVSSTEFINDHQNNEEEQNYIQNIGNEMIHESNIQLSFQKQKQLDENQYYNNSNQLTLANVQEGFQISNNDGEISPDKIKQRKKQLFDPREHQSLMELPQREIQSVYSPSQQQNTPSQNDISLKLEVNPSNSKRVNSSAHLSIDLKIIEDKQKRQSVIKQKLSEMHDHSIDNSVKAISNDQQSQIAKFGSQFDRDDNNKYQLQSLLHNNLPQGLSHYNNFQNRNPANNTSFSSAQNHRNNRNSQHYLNSNQHSNMDGQQNMSNLQIEKSGINNILLTPDSNKFGDEGITSSKMKRIKLSSNGFPQILQQKRDRLVNLFLTKLKESTVLLRRPFNLKSRHYSIINDLSLTNTHSSHKSYQYSPFFQFFGKVYTIISSKLPNFSMIEPNSFFSLLNSMVQSLLILLLIFSTTISMVFPTGEPFIDDFLDKWLAIICICIFVFDIFIHFNTNTVQETDEKKIIPINSRQVVAFNYIKGVFFIDFSAIILLIIDTQTDLHKFSAYLYILRIFIFLKIFSFIQHQSIIKNYFITKGYFIIVYNLVQIMLVIFTLAHLFSLVWFGTAYRLHQDNDVENWIDQIYNSSWHVQYLNSLFWGISQLTLYGSQKPNTSKELIISCFSMSLGYIFFSFLLLWIKSIYDKYNKTSNQENSQQSIQMISDYMAKKCLSKNLQARVFYHIQLESKRRQKKEIEDKQNQIFESLPIELRKEISEQSNLKIIQKIDIFSKIFTQKTLDSLLFYIEEVNYLPNQVIFSENNPDDFSIYYIVDGSGKIDFSHQLIILNISCFQIKLVSTKANSPLLRIKNIFRQQKRDRSLVKYAFLQVIFKLEFAKSFGFFKQYEKCSHSQLSYFKQKTQIGQIRQVSMIALDYVKVGKIKRESFFQVVKNQQDDLERFCMLKDSYILYEDISCLGVNCYSCGKITHTINECPLIHPQFDKVKIIHRHIYSAEQIRNQNYKRRKKYSQSQYFIIKKAVKVQEQLKDDSICHQKLNDLIEQLNIYEIDEDNYEEEEEFDEDEDYIGNSKTIPEEEDTSQLNENQDKLRDDNYTLKNFSDHEDEGLKLQQQQQQQTQQQQQQPQQLLVQQQQIMKQSKQSSGNNNSGRGESNTPNTANNPYTESSSQLSKQVKSLRKDSSSSQLNGDPISNKEYRKEMTYNTVYTDQQFQGYEYFLQESTSNNNNNNNNQNINTSNNINSNNNPTTLNMLSNNATLNNINTNASVEARVSIPDLTQHLIYDHQPPQRIQNKKLTTQTAPQIYSRTKSFASRKSKKQNSSPDQQAQSANEKSILQDLVLDPSLCKEFTRDYTLNSKKSNKRHLKFADESILGMKSDNNMKGNNNPTSSSIQLSPYQESLSSKESNYQSSAQQSNYVIQQFQSLLLKFQSVFRQINQAQRYNSLAQSLDQMKNCDRDSDLQYDLNSHKNSIKDIDHKSSSNQTNKKIETSTVLYKQHTSALSRQAEEWNLDKLKNYKIYYPHNNFSFIYPQIQLIQRLKFKEIQAMPNIPIKQPPSQPIIQNSQRNMYFVQNNEYLQINLPNMQNDNLMEPRKTISTNLTQNRTRKSQYSLTYGVQINSKPFRQFGSLNSGNSPAQRITSNYNPKYQKQQKQQNLSQSNSEYSHIRKS